LGLALHRFISSIAQLCFLASKEVIGSALIRIFSVPWIRIRLFNADLDPATKKAVPWLKFAMIGASFREKIQIVRTGTTIFISLNKR
jgi:hypothetical protein